MSRYLGIDLGTQSLKAIVYDAEQQGVIASASSALELISETDGTREQLASWWLSALHEALAALDKDILGSVVAIGVSGQQHGFTPVAADGSVVAPVKLWCDTATTAECEEITSAFGGEEKLLAEVGNPILPGYTASKILWLKRHNPEAYRQMATIMLPHDYINFYLTGERFAEYGDASGTGLLDIRQRQWHRGMLESLDPERDLGEALPALVGPADIGGQLKDSVAEQLGLPASIPVACGGGDNMMAAIGTGTLAPGRLTMSLGTSGTMFAYSETPAIDPGGELAAFCSSTGGWLPLLCTMNCTVATELARDLFNTDLATLEALVNDSRPGANGVTVLPFYNGERTPNLPNGKGCMLGLDAGNTTPANILRASMEAAVSGLRTGLEAFARVGCDITDIRITGGGSASPAWRQMIADTFTLPVRVPALDEGAALGAAFNALLVHRGVADNASASASLLDEHIRFEESATAQPNQKTAAAYENAYGRYRQYVEQLTPLFE